MDGRDFVIDILQKDIRFSDVIMNLPQNATDFLDVFIGLYTRIEAIGHSQWEELPRCVIEFGIFCYH